MAGVNIWIFLLVSLASLSVILCTYGDRQQENPTQPKLKQGFPCRSNRTTRCPPGFGCSEVSDGVSRCLRKRRPEKQCFDVGFAHIYKGKQTKTINGITCQRWDSTSPQKPWNIKAYKFPDYSVKKAENYCRDPHKIGRPWCYTTDPNDRWDYCDVPECQKPVDCYKYEKVKQYKGFKNVTRDNVQCQRWDSQSPHKHKYTNPEDYPDASLADAGNFCRSPEGRRPWCYTTGKKPWDYCDVEMCTFDFCYDLSWKYRGSVSRTKSGLLCQRWNSQEPHANRYASSPKEFPDATVSDAKNYCRDPSKSGRPWCYTNDPDVRSEYCNIKRCKYI